MNLLSFSLHCFLTHFTPQYPHLMLPFHSTPRGSTTIFTLAHLLPLSLTDLPQQKTPFTLAILYNKSIADAHPSFLLKAAILWYLECGTDYTWMVIPNGLWDLVRCSSTRRVDFGGFGCQNTEPEHAFTISKINISPLLIFCACPTNENQLNSTFNQSSHLYCLELLYIPSIKYYC